MRRRIPTISRTAWGGRERRTRARNAAVKVDWLCSVVPLFSAPVRQQSSSSVVRVFPLLLHFTVVSQCSLGSPFSLPLASLFVAQTQTCFFFHSLISAVFIISSLFLHIQWCRVVRKLLLCKYKQKQQQQQQQPFHFLLNKKKELNILWYKYSWSRFSVCVCVTSYVIDDTSLRRRVPPGC